jgi:hypothetical protein
MKLTRQTVFLLFTLVLGASLVASGADPKPLLDKLRAVGPEAVGSRQAAAAWEKLAEMDADRLPAILTALDGAGPIAANWIRTAADAVVQRALKSGRNLPMADLERFVFDREHNPRARRLAYEYLVQVDTSAPDRLLPHMLDDPSVEIRRDAVARAIDDAFQVAQLSGSAQAVPLYRRALTAARDLDQIRLIAKSLRDSGEQLDLPRHFGFIVRWKLIGPFDSAGGRGYDIAYPPEQEIDFEASYQGKHGTVQWVDHVTADEYGEVDLNRALVEEKGVAAYAAAEFLCDGRCEGEFRFASSNATKVWLNGDLAAAHKVYHAGSQIDQYQTNADLKSGRNIILVKVCQNEQTQSWARDWSFQFRVCDATGGAILSQDR